MKLKHKEYEIAKKRTELENSLSNFLKNWKEITSNSIEGFDIIELCENGDGYGVKISYYAKRGQDNLFCVCSKYEAGDRHSEEACKIDELGILTLLKISDNIANRLTHYIVSVNKQLERINEAIKEVDRINEKIKEL